MVWNNKLGPLLCKRLLNRKALCNFSSLEQLQHSSQNWLSIWLPTFWATSSNRLYPSSTLQIPTAISNSPSPLTPTCGPTRHPFFTLLPVCARPPRRPAPPGGAPPPLLAPAGRLLPRQVRAPGAPPLHVGPPPDGEADGSAGWLATFSQWGWLPG
jgi:hypothetical protein